jgi:hypothetical protein
LIAGCGGEVDRTIEIDSVTPSFGPLSGGTRVVIKGQGFLREGAPPNRVVFESTASPLAAVVDDFTLEAVVPPGQTAGDVPVIVFNENGAARASGLFHYSATPTITGVTPADVKYDTGGIITVTGSGFMDEGAGIVTVLLDGKPQVDVNVKSDTQLTFTALPDQPLVRPNLQVINARGSAERPKAFRYVASTNPVLLSFTKDHTTTWAVLYDPTTGTVVQIPNRSTTQTTGYRTAIFDASGDLWVIGRNSNYGKLDLTKQEIVDPVQLTTGRLTALTRSGDKVFALDRFNGAFGTLDLASGSFAQIGANNAVPCCGMGIAADGNTVYVVSGDGISTLNPSTGARGPIVMLSSPIHVSDMRFLAGTLYAVTNGGAIVTINPSTGAVTTVKQLDGTPRISSLEVVFPEGLQ